MAKYAKWIGGGLGWAFGGPIGGILGFVFGSVVDGIQTIEINSSTRPGLTQYGDFSASLLVLSAQRPVRRFCQFSELFRVMAAPEF